MANQIQLCIYEGYLAADPEMRYLATGKPVTNFRIGSSRQWTNASGEKVKETTWLKITAWGKLGEIVNEYCAKGAHVIVTGKLRVGENGSPTVYELTNGGHGASYEITAEEVRIIDGKKTVAPASDSSDGGDIPF